MKLFLKQIVRSVISNIFIPIPISALLALIIWFFTNVLFSADLSFLGHWKVSYLIIAGIMFAYDFLAVFPVILFTMVSVSRKFSTSLADASEAVIKYNLREIRDWKNWTPEKFENWLACKQVGGFLTKTLIDVIFG